jgi:hypothetical protein
MSELQGTSIQNRTIPHFDGALGAIHPLGRTSWRLLMLAKLSSDQIAILGIVVGAVIGAAGIAVAILVYRWQRERRTLHFEMLSHSALLGSDHREVTGLQLLYNGQPVKDAHLLRIRFVNTGNKEIRPEDFKLPVGVRAENARVLLADVIDSSSPDMDLRLSCADGEAWFEPVLLNPGDSVTVQVMYDDDDQFRIRGRIAGIKEIEPLEKGGYIPTVAELLVEAALRAVGAAAPISIRWPGR